MSPNRGLQPNGIYELRAVRSMQCTDIWANIPNWMPDAGPCFGLCCISVSDGQRRFEVTPKLFL
ncbi:hypothetical protein MUK42_05647 [Musa troglodytarum]|uniref:Uncharacterized protein n=1 Tax=Musa troglodytarum TaxID=320322 RepID=A0A9E7EWU1_9LILI|nr:hypothetical protein MUK42_05647 [Musa troglodytarum]